MLSNLGEHLYVGYPPKLETTGEYFTLEQEDDIEEFFYSYKPIETYDKIIPVTDKIISMLDSSKVPFYELEKKFNILISIKYLWADSYGKNVDDNKLDLEITTYLFNAGSPEIRHIMKLVGFDPTKDLSDKEQLVQIAKSSSEVLKVFIDKAKQSKKSNLE